MINVRIRLGVGVVMSKPFLCFVCRDVITFRERHDHTHVHFNDPNQYLVCRMRKVKKHIIHFIFTHFTCNLCVYLSKYRFTRTKERFIEYARKYNIEVKPLLNME